MKFESSENNWVEFGKCQVSNGDVVTMILDGENLLFKINEQNLGVAFSSPNFK